MLNTEEKDIKVLTDEERHIDKGRTLKRKRPYRAGDNFKLWRPISERTNPDGEVHTITSTATMSTHAMRHDCTHGDFRIGSYTHSGYDTNCDQEEQPSPHSFHQLMVNEETRQPDPRNVSERNTSAAALDRIELVTFTSGTTDKDAFRQQLKRARAEDSNRLQDPSAKRARRNPVRELPPDRTDGE
jgi:hypothetical protein